MTDSALRLASLNVVMLLFMAGRIFSGSSTIFPRHRVVCDVLLRSLIIEYLGERLPGKRGLKTVNNIVLFVLFSSQMQN